MGVLNCLAIVDERMGRGSVLHQKAVAIGDRAKAGADERTCADRPIRPPTVRARLPILDRRPPTCSFEFLCAA